MKGNRKMMGAVIFYGLIIVIILGIILSLFAYVRVPNDKMAFISGFRKRMVSGRLAFYVRAFERVDYLDLAVFSVDVDTKQCDCKIAGGNGTGDNAYC